MESSIDVIRSHAMKATLDMVSDVSTYEINYAYVLNFTKTKECDSFIELICKIKRNMVNLNPNENEYILRQITNEIRSDQLKEFFIIFNLVKNGQDQTREEDSIGKEAFVR